MQATEKEMRIFKDTLVCSLGNGADSASAYARGLPEIGIVESGSGVHRVHGQDFPCRAGDAYVVNGNVPHGYFPTEEGGTLVVQRLRFDPTLLDGEAAMAESARYCYGVFSENAAVSYARLNGQMQKEAFSLLRAIGEELAEVKNEWREAARAHLSLLLISLSRYVGGAIKNAPVENSKDWAIVSAAIRMATEYFGDCTLTLETIADSLYVSKSHLSRLFKKQTGELFSDYLRALRLRYACKLLRETDLTVEDIVRSCGLRDVPSFYHAFNAYMGATPHQYRLTNGNKNKGEKIMQILNEISENLQNGKAKIVKELVQQALDAGVKPADILNDGLLCGMNIVGEKFKNNEVYVPEVLVAARAMNLGTQVLKPYLAESGVGSVGRVCIGTVRGDLHDIGKNLVRMMLEGKGLEVIDLGVDVAPETFVQTAIEQDCKVICCSALLTTTMDAMAEVVQEAEKAGIRGKVKIMIGGAPVNEAFCEKIGADCYTPDAASAADMAAAFCKE